MTTVQTVDDEKRQAIKWLRGVLSAIVDTASLPQRVKKRMASAIRRVPDWYLTRWATALNLDYMKGYKIHPDLAAEFSTDNGRRNVEQYLGAHSVALMLNSLGQVVDEVAKQTKEGRLPVDIGVVEKHVFALATGGCIEDGEEFARSAHRILVDPARPNHPLIHYRLALERADKEKLDRLDNVLTDTAYSQWVTARLNEAKRWFGLDAPTVNIHYGPRTPLWELWWQEFFTGGMYDKRNH